MIRYTAKVLENQRENSRCMRMVLSCPEEILSAVPGQFVMLSVPGKDGRPFLPRPFSIYRTSSSPGSFEILYRVVGPGTRLMAGFPAEDLVGVTGPLGNGFSLYKGVKKCFLVAGGIGVPPIAFLARTISKIPDSGIKCSAFLGGATSDDILCKNDFLSCGMDLHIATEDGSKGAQGLITEILEPEIAKNRPDAVFACGPMPMLNAVGKMANARGIPCQVSIETVMACGLGACMGCAVRAGNRQHGYRHVCKDGPVFEYNAIDLTGTV